MAEKWWLAINADWGDTNNWSLTRGGAGAAGVPGNTDNAHVMDGDGDITANITGVLPLTLEVGGNFFGNIGGSGTALTLATAACVATVENVGPNKLIAIGAAAGVTLAALHVKATGQGRVFVASGAAGIITLLTFGAVGRATVDSSTAVTTLSDAGMRPQILTNSTAITTATFSGGAGSVDLQRNCTTATFEGGANGLGINSVAFTTLNVGALSTYTHDSAGTIAAANVKPKGTLLPKSTPFTITASTLWEGGNISRSSNKITFTAAPVPIGNPS